MLYRATRKGRVLKADTLEGIEQGLRSSESGRYAVTGLGTDCWYTVQERAPICTSGMQNGKRVKQRSNEKTPLYELRQMMTYVSLADIDFTENSVTFSSVATRLFKNVLVNMARLLKREVVRIGPTFLEVKADSEPHLRQLYQSLSGEDLRPEVKQFLFVWMVTAAARENNQSG